MEQKSKSTEPQSLKYTEDNFHFSETKIQATEIEEINGTPFVIIRENEEKPWKLALGNDVCSSKEFKNKKDAVKYVTLKPWELLITSMILINNKLKNK